MESLVVSDRASEIRERIAALVREYVDLAHGRREFVAGESRVQYAGRVFDAREVENLVESSLEFWLTAGRWTDMFEKTMRAFFRASDFMLVNSGSSANLAMMSTLTSPLIKAPLRPGDEVITPAVTFPTTLAPIVQNRLMPVVVDCELGTYNVDPDAVEAAIGPRTRALMIPHTLGNPFDVGRLSALAERHDLYLLEDCCDALGSTWEGRLTGTFGHMASLSFYPAHHMTMGEGGGVIVNRSPMKRAARATRDWGRDCWCAPGKSDTCSKRFGWQLGDLPEGYDHKYIYSSLGYNLKATDMQAAVGVAQFEKLPMFCQRRRENFRRLYAGLAEYEDRLILPRALPQADPAWFGFPITVRPGTSRRELVDWLEARKVETRMIFAGNILRQPGFAGIERRVAGSLEHSDRVMNDTFFVGVYPGLSPVMIDYVVDTFRTFFARR
jgi:CDP-6-deoxy-D-xylo-4-hexulose-3-dehydrase